MALKSYLWKSLWFVQPKNPCHGLLIVVRDKMSHFLCFFTVKSGYSVTFLLEQD